MMNKVYLSLGSNIGNKEKNLYAAIDLLKQNNQIIIEKVSSLYQTEPVGEVAQEDFYNCCIAITTNYSPYELLAFTHQIESILLRVREIHWGPRTIDIDILLFANQIINQDDLIIPHKEMHNRLFVLIPLLEIVADDLNLKSKISQLISDCKDKNQVIKINQLTN